MELIIKSNSLTDFLEETDIINYRHPAIQKLVAQIKKEKKTKSEMAEAAFNFVRDEIRHSFDINGKDITITASETLEKKEGICFAKAHLLAALLRAMEIPCGFCYQKVTRKGTIESGYALHGLNAVCLKDRWFRVDPRGNKPGISSEFCINQEKLAYVIHPELGEEDYPYVFHRPLAEVIQAMKTSQDCGELFYRRPESISGVS